jgi:hypothetical protein
MPMIINRVIQKSQTLQECFCDECGKPADSEKCFICGRHSCEDHGMWEMTNDYRVCRACWDIGEPYREAMRRLDEKADAAKDEQDKAWRAAAKAAQGPPWRPQGVRP